MSARCLNAIARARPALVLLYLLFTSAPAAAHAVLIATVPAAGARIDRAPQAVTLTFGEAVETSLGSVRILDAAGTVHSAGPVTHPDGDANRVSVAAVDMTPGRYVVAWQVVSADSHLVSGGFAFGVGVAAGDAPPAPENNGAALFLPILHFAILAAALLAIGLPIGARAIGGARHRSPAFLEFGSWIVLAFAAFADLAFRTDLAGGTLAGAFSTRIGILRIVTAGASLAGVLALLGRVRRWPLLVPACLVTIASLSLAGHAADGGAAAIGIGADSLHLLAAASWIGVLAIGTTLEDAPELRGISTIAMTAVGVLVVSGIIQTIRNAGSFGALVGTTYGQLIDLKIALLVVLLVIAAGARRLMARGSFAIGRRIRAELWILSLVLAGTAVLVESPLPRDAAPVRTVAVSFYELAVGVHVTATALDARHWKIRVDADGPLDNAIVSATEERRRVGPLDVPLTHPRSNAFTGTLTLPFAGEWRLLASARSGPFDEAHRTLNLPEIAP